MAENIPVNKGKVTFKTQVFETQDRIIPMLTFSDPTEIRIDISEDNVVLQVGPRDWQWDRKTGEMVGCGTMLE
jgi:hypothetical protein